MTTPALPPRPSIIDPVQVGDLSVRNRIWIAPMCTYSVDRFDGIPTDWHRVHYGALAAGGAGLVTVEASAVAPEGRISRQDTGIWADEQVAGWRPIVEAAHAAGAAIGIQLAHAGAKASTRTDFGPDRGTGTLPVESGGWQTVSASAVALMGLPEPRALDTVEVDAVVEAFVAAARRAAAAGFDVVEVHAAHGYLLHQFLSPLSNRRTDRYGGGLAARATPLLDVVRGIRDALPDLPIVVRVSATDWVEGGLTPDDVTEVSAWAIAAGADLVDASSGGLVRAAIPVGPGYQVPLAERIAAANVPASAVGLIDSAAQAEEVVRSGITAVRVGRAALRDPNLPIRWARELGAEVDWIPAQYARAYA